MFLNIPDRSNAPRTMESSLDHLPELNSASVIGDPAPTMTVRGPLRPDKLSPVRDRLSGASLVAGFRTLDQVIIVMLTIPVCLKPPLEQVFAAPAAQSLAILIGAMATIYCLRLLEAYRLSVMERFSFHMLRVTGAIAMGSLIARYLSAMLGIGPSPIVGWWTIMVLLGVIGSHCWAFGYVTTARRACRLTPNIVIVGATENARTIIAQALQVRHLRILGIFDDRIERVGNKLDGVPLLGKVNDLPDHHIMPFVDRVVIALPPHAKDRINSALESLKQIPNAMTLYVAMPEEVATTALKRLADAPLGEQGNNALEGSGALLKRAFDVVASATTLVALAPLLLAIAAVVKLTSPGPALFRQKRHGFNNESITVLKFRSMRTECSDPKAVRQVSANDDRVTAVGRFIRKTSLDELPQLLNVFFGEMSLVGPRPHAIGMKSGDVESARLVAEYAWRHRMKPGITGWAQINGSRGPVDTEEAVRERVNFDIEYIERQNFWLDLYIILVTVPRLLGDKHAVR